MAYNKIKQNYSNIAAAIRAKTGSNEQMTASQIPEKISEIETGITPEGSIDITANGEYDVSLKASASVNVKKSYDFLSPVSTEDPKTGFTHLNMFTYNITKDPVIGENQSIVGEITLTSCNGLWQVAHDSDQAYKYESSYPSLHMGRLSDGSSNKIPITHAYVCIPSHYYLEAKDGHPAGWYRVTLGSGNLMSNLSGRCATLALVFNKDFFKEYYKAKELNRPYDISDVYGLTTFTAFESWTANNYSIIQIVINECFITDKNSRSSSVLFTRSGSGNLFRCYTMNFCEGDSFSITDAAVEDVYLRDPTNLGVWIVDYDWSVSINLRPENSTTEYPDHAHIYSYAEGDFLSLNDGYSLNLSNCRIGQAQLYLHGNFGVYDGLYDITVYVKDDSEYTWADDYLDIVYANPENILFDYSRLNVSYVATGSGSGSGY